MDKKTRWGKIIFILAIFYLISIKFFEIKLATSIYLILCLIASYKIYKEKIGQELIIAFLFSLIITSYYIYEYTKGNIFLGRLNLFPLVSGTTALVFLREIYERVKTENRFVFTSLLYLTLLFLVEYIGYYLFEIRLNSNFPDLFGLGIIHAPVGMKFFYIFAGPIYLLVTDYLKTK